MIDIKSACYEISDWLINVRRDLHKTPELGLEEFETKAKIIKYLKEIGVDYIEYKNHTGITAFIDGNHSKTAAIRADIDALPIDENLDLPFKSIYKGKMHACGHDAHTAMLLGACKVLFKLKDQLNVNVKFFFQPAEETVGGARLMIEDGCMENPKVDFIFGIHVMPHIESGTIELKYNNLNASTDTIFLTIRGSKAHGAYPHKGVDAIVVASHIISALQTIVSRNTDPSRGVVISLGMIEGGISENIICDKVNIRGTIRTLDNNDRSFVKERINEICKFISKSFDASYSLEIKSGYPALINSNNLVNYVRNNLCDVFGDEKIIIRKSPSMGAEDFSFFLSHCEGVFYHIGCANEKKGLNAPLHSSEFNIDESCLVIGVISHVKNILSLN